MKTHLCLRLDEWRFVGYPNTPDNQIPWMKTVCGRNGFRDDTFITYWGQLDKVNCATCVEFVAEHPELLIFKFMENSNA